MNAFVTLKQAKSGLWWWIVRTAARDHVRLGFLSEHEARASAREFCYALARRPVFTT